MGPLAQTLVSLAAAAALAAVARLLVPSARSLGWSTSILTALVAAAAAVGFAQWLDLGNVAAVLVAVGVVAVATAVVAALHARRRPPAGPASWPLADLLTNGESARVEYKSSARRNLRTGERDERLEQVIAKTVAGFLNADGGVLLVGVDDRGTAVGIEPDRALMKSATDDAYEQWLRDHLSTCLGTAAAASVRVSFVAHDGQTVCRLDVGRSPSLVFLTPPKTRERQLWVRSGNGTRQLQVDEALRYERQRRRG